eukprot:6697895-Alexandrium_andersonii.AAC.1
MCVAGEGPRRGACGVGLRGWFVQESDRVGEGCLVHAWGRGVLACGSPRAEAAAAGGRAGSRPLGSPGSRGSRIVVQISGLVLEPCHASGA